jgi:hypothetical protein
MTTGRASTLAAVLILAVLPAAGQAQQRSQAVPTERLRTPAAIGVHGFSVVLVVGGMQGSGATDNVPEAARKALADMKDFLPYKRYQLLDAAWILCCGTANNGVSGRVRGPDGRDYLYVLDPGSVVGSKLNVRFTMREAQDPSTASVNVEKLSDTARLEFLRQQAEAARELDEAGLQVRTIRQRFEVGTATPSEMEAATLRARRAQQRAQDLQRIGGGAHEALSATLARQARGTGTASGGGRGGSATRGVRELMDSSFSITLGETVVIGTSRLNGDQALIAILTAATKPGASR